jgi:hypothetical protein
MQLMNGAASDPDLGELEVVDVTLSGQFFHNAPNDIICKPAPG